MLDHFLEIVYQGDQQRSIRNEMAEGLKNLPVDELRKIASGELKLAGYDDDDWLCKFKCTDLYDEALALETECLELEAEQQKLNLEDSAERRERNDRRSELWDAKDAVRLKKRLLELELRRAELAAVGGQEAMQAPEFPGAPVEAEEESEEGTEFDEEEPEEKDAAAYFVNRHRDDVMAKFAKAGLLTRGKHAITRGVETLKGTRAGKAEESASKMSNMAKRTRDSGTELKEALKDYDFVHVNEFKGPSGKVYKRRGSGSVSDAMEQSAKRYDRAASKAKGVAEGERKATRRARIGAGAVGGTAVVGGTAAALSGSSDKPKTAHAHAVMAQFAESQKEAAAMPDAMQIADYWGRRMAYTEVEKEAGLGQMAGTVWKGVKGAGDAVGALASRGTTAYQKGGMEGLQKALTRGGKQTMQRAGQFVVDNPAAAGVMGAGALGATALGAGALGRASA